MPNPAVSTFPDSFATYWLSTCWSNWSFTGGSAHGASGVDGGSTPGLLLDPGSTPYAGGGWIETKDIFDLTGDTATIHVAALPATLGGPYDYLAYLSFTCEVIDDQMAEFVYSPSTGELAVNADTTATLTGSIPLYWRFRGEGDGSVIHCETSPDGSVWTDRAVWNYSPVHLKPISSVQINLRTQSCRATVSTYNGGGTPSCPSLVPVAGYGRARACLIG